MPRSNAWLLMILVGGVLALAAACGGSKSGSCAQGTERCPCYGNSTCNPGLACMSDVCVSSGGTGGTSASGGRGGTTGTGGRGGASAGGTGGVNAGGNGGATGGAGGQSGAGGSASCGDTTSDWHNCGACGHACANQGQFCGTSCCVAGVCAPFWGPCFAQSAGYTACAQACSSVGQTCVAQACTPTSATSNGYTWLGWSTATASTSCSVPQAPESVSTATCDTTLTWTGTNAVKRCCCTDN
jgi:hypothetical protein